MGLHLQVVALHKDHYVFPLTIAVTKASGSGADAVFMGVLRPLDDQPDTVKAWLMPAGVLVCAGACFTVLASVVFRLAVPVQHCHSRGAPMMCSKWCEVTGLQVVGLSS